MTPEELQELEERSKDLGVDGLQARMELDRYNQAQADTEKEEKEEAEELKEQALADNRPVWLAKENPIGNAIGDTGKILANAGLGLVTDVVDLALGIGDTAVQVGNLAQGKEFELDNWFNDSDNPWTEWRRDTFKTSTQAGQTVSNFVRLGTLLATLPKAIPGIASTGIKLAAGASKGSRIAKGAKGLQAAQSASRNAQLTSKIQAIAKGLPAGSNAQKAADIAANTPEISKALSSATTASKGYVGLVDASYTAKVGQRLKNVGLSIAERYKPRNLAQTLGYDALATFMVAGEGELDFDETLSDFLADVGSPIYIPGLTTDVGDSAISVKMKQMAEGSVVGVFMQPLIDMWTISRYAKRIKNADPKVKKQLIEAFSLEVNDLGTSVAKVYTGEYRLSGPGIPGPTVASQIIPGQPLNNNSIRDPWSVETTALARSERGALARLVDDTVQQQRLQKAELTEMVPPASERFVRQQTDPFFGEMGELATRGDLRVPGELATRGDLRVPGELAPQKGSDLVDQAIEPVDVRISSPVTYKLPGQISEAFAADASTAMRKAIEEQDPEIIPKMLEGAKEEIKQLMPASRVEAIDYLTDNAAFANNGGVISASDSVWMNSIVERGRKEGWIQIDDDFNLTTTREVARSLDTGDAAKEAAKNVDEAIQLEELSANTGVDTNLGQVEATRNADVQLAKAAETMQREAARVAPKAPGAETDRQLIKDVLGLDVDEVVDLYVEKAPQGRKHQVVKSDGTVVGQFTRKSQAEKYVLQQSKKITDDLVRRAKQAQADALPQRLDVGDVPGAGGTNEPLMGKLTFTKVQKDVLAQFSDELGELLNANAKQKTYNFDYYEMAEFIEGLEMLVNSGEFKGSKLRVLRNLLDKIKTVKTELDPIAQARAKADEITRLAQREIDHNDYC